MDNLLDRFEIKNKELNFEGNFMLLAELIDKHLPDGRYKSLALTSLEECELWCLKGVK